VQERLRDKLDLLNDGVALGAAKSKKKHRTLPENELQSLAKGRSRQIPNIEPLRLSMMMSLCIIAAAWLGTSFAGRERSVSEVEHLV
jgi:hypothetical protein